MSPLVRISGEALAIACGADAVAEAVRAAGARVERTSAWGMDWLEPLVEIAGPEGGTGFGPVAPADVPAILAGTSALGIGQIAAHPFLARQTRLTFARAGTNRPLSLADYAASGGWQGLERARALAPDQVIAEIGQSGLRGRGGAGFPAGIKWQTVANAAGPNGCRRKFIVCNADEGDSGTFADRMLLEGDPFAILEGMAIAAHAVGAGAGYLYIRSEYPQAIAAARAAVDLAAAHLAPFTVEVRVGAGAYVCGEETALLNSIEGKRGVVRAKPPLPAISGLFGCPTVVNNVLTLAAASHILREGGAEQYAALGVGRSRGTMPVQLAGAVRHGGLVEVPFGITLRELIHDIGGGTTSGRPVKAAQVGGPLGAYVPPGGFDLPLDYEAFAAADALIGHGGVVVLDDTADMGRLARFAMEFCAVESCGKCTPCRIGATRGVELIDRIRAATPATDPLATLPQMRNAPKAPHTRDDDIALLEELCDTMHGASLCALGGFVHHPVLSALRHWPQDFTRDFTRDFVT